MMESRSKNETMDLTANQDEALEAEKYFKEEDNRSQAQNQHPHPDNFRTLRTLGFTLPPSGFFARVPTRVLICIIAWITLYSVLDHQVLPGGNIFGLYTVIVLASFFGFLVRIFPLFKFPPLLGMLIAGFLLRNLPGPLNFVNNIDRSWSAFLRSVALVVILLRSGLELDPGALKRLKFTVLRLAFGPCIVEAVTVALMARWLLDMPWLWAFQLGFVMGAVSPAVVVPQLLILQEKGFGTQQGIPTLVMAASSCDDVLAISLFGVFLGVAFSQGNLIFNIFRGPLELVMGLVFGVFIGTVCWLFPNKAEPGVSRDRFVLLFGCGLLSMFGSNAVEFSGAGALGVLTMATIAAYGWGNDGKEPICYAMGVIWEFFQPLLFSLIGAEVRIEYIQDGKIVGRCFGVLIISLGVRLLVTYIVALGNNLTVKEKLFIAVAWLPKATVQVLVAHFSVFILPNYLVILPDEDHRLGRKFAAIGSMSLDVARSRGYTGQFQEDLGIQILTTAVISILMTAPVGAVLISITGPRLLRRVLPVKEIDSKDKTEMTSLVACDKQDVADAANEFVQVNTTV